MILIGLGANLEHPEHGSPRETVEAALEALAARGVKVAARSPWYRSEPVPVSDQPWFVNGVAALESDLPPAELLELLHEVEAEFGRVRRERNEARVLDLDLLAYGDKVSGEGESPVLPHPRLETRAFVVLPLADLAPAWRHPVSGRTAAELARDLSPAKGIERAEP